MSKIITFGNTILAESGKRGILKPIEPGGEYYRLNAGGFNIPNRGGITYTLNNYLRECMREDSDLNRRVSEGQVQMELGHPLQYFYEMRNGVMVRTNITDLFQWIHRLRTILDPHVCGFIRKIIWEMTGGDNDPIYNYIEARPFGVNEKVFRDSILDPDINTAVSIRTVTAPQKVGHTTREVDYFSTYDLVIEQGMLNACKHRTAGLEDYLSTALAEPDPVSVNTTVEEFFFVCDTMLKSDRVLERFGGMEGFKNVNSMLDTLKSQYRDNTSVKLVSTNSLGVFG